MVKVAEPNEKVRISIAVDQSMLSWIDQMVRREFSPTEAMPYIGALVKLKEEAAK